MPRIRYIAWIHERGFDGWYEVSQPSFPYFVGDKVTPQPHDIVTVGEYCGCTPNMRAVAAHLPDGFVLDQHGGWKDWLSEVVPAGEPASLMHSAYVGQFARY